MVNGLDYSVQCEDLKVYTQYLIYKMQLLPTLLKMQLFSTCLIFNRRADQ